MARTVYRPTAYATISSSQANCSPYPPSVATTSWGPVDVYVTINSGVTLYGSDNLHPALTISGTMPVGSNVYLTNNGSILGGGGALAVTALMLMSMIRRRMGRWRHGTQAHGSRHFLHLQRERWPTLRRRRRRRRWWSWSDLLRCGVVV